MGLAALRKNAGLTLKELAAKSAVNYVKIHHIEHRKISPENITLRTAQKLATALDCEIKELLEPDEEV